MARRMCLSSFYIGVGKMVLSKSKRYRMARLNWLLARGDIILLRTLPNAGVRLIHYEWPQSRYLDYWPETSTFRTGDDRAYKGWAKLLKMLDIGDDEWRTAARTIHASAA